MLSLGTGEYKLDEYPYEKIRKWGIVKWFKPIINIILSISAEIIDYELKILYEAFDASKNYHRINPPIVMGSRSIEKSTKENMKDLKQDALNYINENKEYLDDIAKQLIDQDMVYKTLLF